MERAKQVTMAELNAVIGVRGLPGLPPTVCILLLTLYLNQLMCMCVLSHFFNKKCICFIFRFYFDIFLNILIATNGNGYLPVCMPDSG